MQLDQIKAKYQAEAIDAIDKANGFGLIAMATGTGKSKIAVDKTNKLINFEGLDKILLVVPTEKLRDEGWANEFDKWGFLGIYEEIERTCYASLHSYEGEEYDLVILDECHNITENNSIFFHNNTVHSCIGLTATPPTDPIKINLLAKILKCNTYRNEKNHLRLYPTYEVTLDEAVNVGLVAPYDITVITLPLDTTDKYIVGGNIKNHFMQTELQQYSYLTRLVEFGSNPMNRINRMRFIYNLKSKTEAAKKILEHAIPKNLRTLIFCGSKIQADAVCEHRYYSKPVKPKIPTKFKGLFSVSGNIQTSVADKMTEYITYTKKLSKYEEAIKNYQGNDSYNLFFEEKINKLSCCQALNEGENIPKIDVGFITQLNSQELDFVQRMGRIIRIRDGHVGKIIILATEGTVDMDWVHKATAKLDKTKIRYISYEDLRTGKETINFN